jgi:hypothetical protein
MTLGDKRKVGLSLAFELWASKCVGWLVVKTLGIHDQEET